jgi:hypothetical protein
MDYFAAARKTELRQRGELDKIFGVTYPMVNAYMTGKSLPTRSKKRIDTALAVFNTLVEQGKLPFPEGKDKDSRANAVEKIAAHVAAKSN